MTAHYSGSHFTQPLFYWSFL